MGKKSQSQGKKKAAEEDERFKGIATNPLFKEIPRKERKIVVDERFQSMFTDDRFKLGNFKVDKRGRKLDLSSNQHLANLYDMESSDDDNSSDDEEREEGDEESSDEEVSNAEIKLDLARGEGNLSSSAEESDEYDDADEGEDQPAEDGAINSWGEIDRSVDRVEWASRRIAICNLDWDRLRADDLLVVLNSFKPESGAISSVGIYLSDFGAERLETEETKGPTLPGVKKGAKGSDEKKSKEMIRAYQLERLRYYYAVCECDSEETAIAIYEGCDGVEYETSGVRFDLRFIPTNMEFDESRLREKVSTEDVNVEKYRPKRFESMALSNCNAKLTWDETDPERTISITEAFKEDSNLKSFENLLAPPSDSEEEDGERLNILLGEANKRDPKTAMEGGGNLRVEWDSQSNHEVDAEVEEDSEEGDDDASEVPNTAGKKKGTPFQEYLERRKQKRKERKAQIAEKRREGKSATQEEDESARKPGTKGRKRTSTNDTDMLDLGDNRFSSLFTDSAFAIDKTHPHFKGGVLANQQVDEKHKRISTKRHKVDINTSSKDEGLFPERSHREKESVPYIASETTEDLVEKLKKKASKSIKSQGSAKMRE